MHFNFRAKFHPNTIDYGFWPNFHPDTIHFDFRAYAYPNTTDYGFWPSFHPNKIPCTLIFGLTFILIL